MSSESLESTEIVTCSTSREIGRTSALQREWERNRINQFFQFSDIRPPSITDRQQWSRGSNRNIDRSIDRSTNRSIKVSNCNPCTLRLFRSVLKDIARPTSISMPDWHLTRLITNDKERGWKENGSPAIVYRIACVYTLFIDILRSLLSIYFITACKTVNFAVGIFSTYWFNGNLMVSCSTA